MIRLYLAFILSLFTLYIYAQQPAKKEIDSLQGFSVESLATLAAENRYKNPLQAKAYASVYYVKAQNNGDVKKVYDAAFLKAEIYNVLREKDSAHFFIDESIEKASNTNDEDHYYKSLRLKGIIYYSSRDYEKASSLYTEVYQYYEEEKNVVELAKIRHNIALIENQIGRRKQALMKVKENFNLYKEGVLDKDAQMPEYLNTLLNLSNIYTTIADDFNKESVKYLDSAITYNTIGLEKSLQVNDLEIYTIFLTLQGIIHQKKGNLNKAHSDFISAEEKIINLGFFNQLAVLYMHQGKNYFLKDEVDNALRYLLKTDSINVNEGTYSPHLQETYILLAKSYGKKGDLENSVKYFEIFEEKDKKNDIRIRNISENLYKKYDIPSFKNKIQTLLNKTEQEQQKSKTLIYACISLVVFLLGVLWYYKRRERKLKKRFDMVLEELVAIEKAKIATKDKISQPYTITDENVQKILDGLEKFERKQLFLQKKCTLNYVAKKINTNSTYLSKTLQSHKQKKFVQYITDLRLNYALTRLKDDTKFRTYDIKSIAAELGFNTAESFSKAFKKRTGIYPSFYIKNLNKLKD
ncbi:helix-turn-helix domain-containing protein [Kordia sp.]|uniref:helix-turn-helix domain-containing protein n=1 Tax=Kordia sp. TaxID=1965332 RepID=UPI003B5A9C1F